MKYFPHIDGLRCAAVISVILFHLDINWFDGGFVGVDVFFVISGFLITSIIVKEIQSTQNFSFKKFYIRRARRLLPALFSIFAICLVVALLLYSSERLYDLGVELIFSVISAANFLFWIKSGYFDTGADSKLLLHMWSLSVEEQFYIFWPFLLVVLYKRFSRKIIFILGVVAFVVSLSVNIILSNIEISLIRNQSEMMFYLMPFRVYEFLIGAFGVWAFNRMPKNKFCCEMMFWLGATAIVYSVTQYSSAMKFPYYSALLPCIGTLFMILSRGSFAGKIFLENKLVVFIGLISYTLYLVHWPVIVFYKYFRLAELSSLDKVVVAIITLCLTLTIYFYIEKPLRKPKALNIQEHSNNRVSNTQFLKGSLGITFTFIAFGLMFYITSGLSKYKNELITEEELVVGKSMRYNLIRKGCLMAEIDSIRCNNERSIQVLVLGDSHEPDGYNIFHTMYGEDSSVNLIRFGGTHYCDDIDTNDGEIYSSVKRRGCDERVNKLNNLDFVNSLDVVVFSSNRPFEPNKLSAWRILEHISSVNKTIQIIVLGTYFNTNHACSEIANRFNDLQQCKSLEYLSYIGNKERDKIYNSEVVNATKFIYLSKFAALCDTSSLDSCPVSAGGEPMFYDKHHLSLSFARLIGARFLDVYKGELEEAGFSVATLQSLPNNK